MFCQLRYTNIVLCDLTILTSQQISKDQVPSVLVILILKLINVNTFIKILGNTFLVNLIV